MGIKFTPAQEKAIISEGQNILVSAGAGSGKTAVLTERVFRLLTEKHIPIEHLLVLTFTRAAAHEMKKRIKARLQTEATKELAQEIDNALITTFDAFASYLVRKYHYHLGLHPQIDNLDETFVKILREQFFAEIRNEYYEKNDPRFAALINQYTVRDASQLWDLVYRFDAEIDKRIDGDAYLNHYMDDHFSNQFFEQAYQKYLDIASECIEEINDYLTLISEEVHQRVLRAFFAGFINDADLEDTLKKLHHYEERFPTKKPSYNEEDKLLHDQIKSVYLELKELADFGSKAEIKQHYFQTQEHVAMIVELTSKLREKMTAYKKKHQVFTFSDIAKMAMQLLDYEQVIGELRSQLRYIIIDEYQDTSDLQEALLQKLADNNLYMVGDIKQSIYRFRNANSDIFQQKYLSYQDGRKGLVVDMNENFRSRREVLADINSLFGELMSLRYGGADYRRQHQIVFGNQAYEDPEKGKLNQSRRTQVLLYDASNKAANDKKLTTAQKEALIIAREIKRLIDSQFLIYDHKAQKKRPVTYQDIAILVDRRVSFTTYQQILESFYIPLKVHQDREIMTAEANQVLQSLVRLIVQLEESEDDSPILRHHFLSVARSYLLQLPDDITYHLLTEEDGKKYLTHPLMLKIKRFTEKTRDWPLKSRITQLIFEFDLIEKLPLIGDVQVNLYLFEELVATAGTLEKLGFTLKDFSEFFIAIIETEQKFEISDHLAPQNAVQLMTIHKSKGLEFPVVFYCGLSSRFNFRDFQGSFLVDSDYGVILPSPENPSQPNLFKLLIANKEKVAFISEQIRLLYVALTRAREQIYLVLPTPKEGFAKPIIKCSSFAHLLYGWTELDKRVVQVGNLVLPDTIAPSDLPKVTVTPIAVKNYQFEFTKKETTSFAKMIALEVEQTILAVGERLHYFLSLINWDIRDASFIENDKERRIINRLLNLSIFDGLKDKEVYTEYEFYDLDTQKVGIIDFFALLKDKIILVDFKLANIADSAYDQQVTKYAQYLKKMFNLPIEAYLVSINQAEFRQVALPPDIV
ncbi:MAG: UvrD-helicase domain-containing protein [Bacilli bacterium]